jgi:hypothetical protein
MIDPLCERQIVHGGRQSLALDYNNVDQPYFTGLERTWDIAMDWTVNGLDTLVLYIRGQATNDPDPLYITVKDAAGKSFTEVHFPPNTVQVTEWVEWRIPLSKEVLAGVNPKGIKSLSIIVGDRTGSEPGGSGRIYIDDIMVVRAETFPWLGALEYAYPRDGDVNVPHSVVLQWWAGEGAAYHDVYFGADANAVAEASPLTEGIYQGRQAHDETRFDLGPLEWNKTYFWRIDEVNDAHPFGPQKGKVRRFTTADFLVIDDFERYTDEEGERLYEFWIDGWYEENGTGSIVGDMVALFARKIVSHNGWQAMPFSYDNSALPYYSEAYRTWETPQDWTIRGGTDLSLWLKGRPASFIEDPNGRIIVNGYGGDTTGTGDSYSIVCKQLVGNGEIVARIDSLSNAKGWARAGVIIYDTQVHMLQYATMTVTAEYGSSFVYRAGGKTSAARITTAGIQTPHWVKLTRTGNVLTAQHSTDGQTWLDLTDEMGKPVAATVAMPASVSAGLCVISDKWDKLVTAEFSAIATTGDIRGPWQATYGGLNSRDDLYVALEDAVGRLAMSVHPDPGALNFADWTQWRIPLSDFATAGVDVTAVKTMYIGMGNRDNPQPNGTGMIHIDDIHVLPTGDLPTAAFGPYPPNGAVDVPQSPLLMWRAGEAATHHDIYFGDDANSVTKATTADAVYRGRLSAKETAFDPGPLEWNKTYFWRVDAVNETDPNNSWKGKVWRFTTADFLVVDDFESYSDEEGNRLYEWWIDAFAWQGSGVVARMPPGPYVERTIVHSGRQSMPFNYDNVRAPWYSEIERDFGSAQNWRVNDVDTLVLYMHGQATNAPAPLFVMIRDIAGKIATAAYPDASVTQATEWVEWRIPLSQFAGVNTTRVRRLTLGVGDRAKPTPGGAGRIYIDDIRVIRSAH